MASRSLGRGRPRSVRTLHGIQPKSPRAGGSTPSLAPTTSTASKSSSRVSSRPMIWRPAKGSPNKSRGSSRKKGWSRARTARQLGFNWCARHRSARVRKTDARVLAAVRSQSRRDAPPLPASSRSAARSSHGTVWSVGVSKSNPGRGPTASGCSSCCGVQRIWCACAEVR